MGYFRGVYKVIVAGADVTSRFAPLLESLSVEKVAGEAADTASIKCADPQGVLFLPAERAPVRILLQGIDVFEGFVAEVNCSIDKGGGRTMDISASSIDQGGKGKQPALRHKDETSLSSVAQEWGSKADLQVQTLGSIAGIQRKYWIQQNESFVSWGQRIAREVGGTFKVVGKRGFLVARNEGISASGRLLTPIVASVGFNLLSGSVAPIISRPKYNEVGISWFDIKKGEKKEVKSPTPVSDVQTMLRQQMSVFDEKQAKERGEALGKESDRDKGQGSVEIVGNPVAEPEATCTIVGWRPGVDGTYRIHSVSHSLDKGGGFTTSVSLRQPQGGAGADGR